MRRAALGWAAAGVAIHLALVGAFLIGAGGNPSRFARDYDGPAFWLLARDPLLRNERQLATLLDPHRPAYRAQRIGYPLLASVWRLGGDSSLLWGLLATNLLVVFAGGLAAALLAAHMGAPGRASLAFALCPGVVAATLHDLGDGLAIAALLAVLLAMVRGRTGWAVAAGVVAVLAREPTMLGLAGIALLAPRLPRRSRSLLVLVPGMAALAWGIYARWRLGGSLPSGIRAFSLPFRGYVDAWRLGWRPVDAAVAVALLPLAGIVIGRWVMRRSLLLSTAVPFVCLLPFFSERVLASASNSARVLSPAITLLVLDLYARNTTRARDHSGDDTTDPGAATCALTLRR